MRIASKSKNLSTSRVWAENEFGRACLPDQRLRKRLITVASDFLDNIDSSIPEACGGNWARTKGAYRFFDHDEVAPESILASHRLATVERMKAYQTVLAIQDTSVLNFSNHPCTAGLGVVGSADRNLGMLLHTTLAMTTDGVALGLLDVQSWTRPVGSQGKAARRANLPIEQKESYKWLKSFDRTVEVSHGLPETRLISVADREGDLYELLMGASVHPNVGVLVRSRQSRPLQGREELSWQQVAMQPLAGRVMVQVPRQPGKAARQAWLEIRFARVTLRAPKAKPKAGPLQVWAVEGREVGVPASRALHWRLVTTVAVNDLEDAVERLRWYELRWQVEEFHRVLKSGCGAEKRQLESVERLEKVLRLDMIVAWRVLELSRKARQEPGRPAETELDKAEIEVVRVLLKKKDKQPLGLREAVRRIAQLGGFLGRKSDGEPGAITLWRGLRRLEQITAGYQLAKSYG